MKFESKKITQSIDMAELNEAYSGGVIHVWVNPPKSVRKEREELLKLYAQFFRGAIGVDAKVSTQRPVLSGLLRFFKNSLPNDQEKRLQQALQRVYAWFAELWSQHPDPDLHWTADELAEMNERDPALYRWLINRSVSMIDTFQVDKKK